MNSKAKTMMSMDEHLRTSTMISSFNMIHVRMNGEKYRHSSTSFSRNLFRGVSYLGLIVVKATYSVSIHNSLIVQMTTAIEVHLKARQKLILFEFYSDNTVRNLIFFYVLKCCCCRFR